MTTTTTSSSSSATEFVDKVVAIQPELAGSNDVEKSKIQKIQQEVGDLVKDLKALDVKLTPLTYLYSSTPTSADISLYCELHPELSKMEIPTYYSIPSVTRYFDHIQHLKPVTEARSLLNASPYILKEFDLTKMPALERKVEVKEKKVKKLVDGEVQITQNEKKVKKKEEEEEEGNKKNEETVTKTAVAGGEPKKDGKKKEKKEKPAAAVVPPSEPMPSMIDLRVGKVLEVSKHPDAESLYIEKIDIGEETGPRIVCSGLVAYMSEDQIKDQTVIVVCNLKPATMRGVKSFAMLLCATSAEGKEAGIEFVRAPPGSQPGERVYFEGEKYENATPEALLNPKKKVFETIQPGFITLDTLEAAWIDPNTKSVHKIRTKDGICKVEKFAGASLS